MAKIPSSGFGAWKLVDKEEGVVEVSSVGTGYLDFVLLIWRISADF